MFAAEQNTFRVDLDVIGFDRVRNRALRDRFRAKRDALLNKLDVNEVVQVRIEGVRVMYWSGLNLPTPFQDTRQFQADMF